MPPRAAKKGASTTIAGCGGGSAAVCWPSLARGFRTRTFLGGIISAVAGNGASEVSAAQDSIVPLLVAEKSAGPMSTLQVDQVAGYVPQLDRQDRHRVNPDLHGVVLAAGHVPVDRSTVPDVHGDLS